MHVFSGIRTHDTSGQDSEDNYDLDWKFVATGTRNFVITVINLTLRAWLKTIKVKR
jgi:hypothetical protein